MSCQLVLADALPPGEIVELQLHLHLDPDPRQVGRARRFVLEHVPRLSPETRDTVELLTSELVTNAVLHAGTPLEVGVAIATKHVLVTVHDLGLAPLPQDGSREGGRGLSLVDALADHWATVRHPSGGKTAWFSVLRDA